MDRMEELLETIEEIQASQKKFQLHKFLFNQPNLISISSADRVENNDSQNGFYRFEIQFKRPALEVQSIQLLQINIPQCNPFLANSSCVFWYYRISKANPVPCLNNLFFVRLLPSFYKKENIQNPELYGFNTFAKSYTSLANQLKLSCQNDLCLTNYEKAKQAIATEEPWFIPFCPRDIQLTYNGDKFEMTGTLREPFILPWNVNTLYQPYNTTLKQLGPDQYSKVQGYVARYANRGLNPESTLLPTWSEGTSSFQSGNIVVYQSTTYQCNVSITSSLPPSQLPGYFNVIDAKSVSDIWSLQYGDVIQPWDYTTIYPPNRYIEYDSRLFKSIEEQQGRNPGDFPQFWEEITSYTNWYSYLSTGYADPNVAVAQGKEFLMPWSKYPLYQTNTIVRFQNKNWKAFTQNQGAQPTFIPEFDFNVLYSVGQYVWGLGDDNIFVYMCIAPAQGKLPSNTEYWSPITSLAWSTTKTYNKYEIVSWNGYWYQSLQYGNINQNPSANPTYWTNLGINAWIRVGNEIPDLSGLFASTELFDMLETRDSSISFPFPFGVGGQPFVEKPRRILNTILGFTWNGIFEPELLNLNTIPFDTEPVNGGYALVSNTQYLLFNRLRPIPLYFVIQAPPLLSLATSSTSLTYTAEGYANLVYSNVLSIYTNIIGSSSLDTQRNTDLIGIASMNVGPLGVSSWSNYIDNPLLKIRGDIYGLTIEFRDEFGEPYYLTNNAVATLSFKATYEK